MNQSIYTLITRTLTKVITIFGLSFEVVSIRAYIFIQPVQPLIYPWRQMFYNLCLGNSDLDINLEELGEDNAFKSSFP